jgi:hypothetical protein
MPAVAPLRRREDLRGMVCGHWTVIDGGELGYWLARCHCGATQDVRLNATQTHIPPCRSCGSRTDAGELPKARAAHRATGAFYLGKYGR